MLEECVDLHEADREVIILNNVLGVPQSSYYLEQQVKPSKMKPPTKTFNLAPKTNYVSINWQVFEH